MKTFLIILFIFLTFSINAKTTTSVTDGNWNVTGTWDNGKPSTGDVVIVNHNVVYNVNFDVGSGSVTVNSGGSLIGTGKNLNMWGDGSGKIINYGTLTFQNHDGYGTIENYGNFTCNKINSQYTNSKFINGLTGIVNIATFFNQWGTDLSEFHNEGIVNIAGTSSSSFVGAVFENSGTLTVTANTLILTPLSTTNTGTIDVFNINAETIFNNSGTLKVRGNIDDFYTNNEFYNSGECIVDGFAEIWGTTFENTGFLTVSGYISVSQLNNSGQIITMGDFNNWATNPVNNGAIYVIGTGDFKNQCTGPITSTTCGHINVGCNNFLNDSDVTGNMNIYGNRTGFGSYAASVTYNPYCPCDFGITYYSRDDGNWDEYDLCGGGKSVWSLEQIYPAPIYEYPKLYGNVIIENNTIEVDATCDQPLTCDSLTLAPLGFLTIDATKTLNVSEDFLIKSPENTGATGSLIDNGTLNVTGTKTVQRYITGLNWHYLGFPVDNVAGSDFNQTNFYFYDESNNDTWNADDIYGVSGWERAGTGSLTTPMQGFIYYYNDDMLQFTGNLNTGNQSISLSYTNNNPAQPQFDGWNLVANPYPSSIDWDNVTTTGIVDNCVYFYDDDGGSPYFNNYKYYIKGGGGASPYPSISLNNANQYIPLAQAFFVRTTTNGQNFSFDNSVRTHSSQDFYKSGNEIHPDLLKLQIRSNSSIDETVIRFIPQAGENFDGEFDAIKMYSYEGDLPNLYSITQNSQNLAINTLPNYKNRTVQLGFKTNIPGEFTISVSELNFDNTDDIYLFDKQEDYYQNLKENPSYKFYSQSGNNTNRFEILFGMPTYIEEINNQINIYSYDNQINIIQKSQEINNLSISVFSIDGRLIKSIETSNTTTNLTIETSGVYIVNVINTDKRITKKVFIQ